MPRYGHQTHPTTALFGILSAGASIAPCTTTYIVLSDPEPTHVILLASSQRQSYSHAVANSAKRLCRGDRYRAISRGTWRLILCRIMMRRRGFPSDPVPLLIFRVLPIIKIGMRPFCGGGEVVCCLAGVVGCKRLWRLVSAECTERTRLGRGYDAEMKVEGHVRQRRHLLRNCTAVLTTNGECTVLYEVAAVRD